MSAIDTIAVLALGWAGGVATACIVVAAALPSLGASGFADDR